MPDIRPYDRAAAVAYAHRWAHSRNPDYYNFDEIGGDCTSFASQCLYAGAGVMNFTPTFGWYYRSIRDRAPAWTGVPYFYNFLTRTAASRGPFAVQAPLEQAQPGDFVQLRFASDAPFTHTPVVVAVLGLGQTPEEILVAAHSLDSDFRPLSTYPYEAVRLIHILGVRV